MRRRLDPPAPVRRLIQAGLDEIGAERSQVSIGGQLWPGRHREGATVALGQGLPVEPLELRDTVGQRRVRSGGQAGAGLQGQ